MVVFTGEVSLQGWDFPPSVCRSLVVGGGGSCGSNTEPSGGSSPDSTKQRLRVEHKPSSSPCPSSSFCSSSSSSWPRLRAVGCAETGGAVNADSLPSSTPHPHSPSPPTPDTRTGPAPVSLDGEKRLKKGERWSWSTLLFLHLFFRYLLLPYCSKRKLRVRNACSLGLSGQKPPCSCAPLCTTRNMHYGVTSDLHASLFFLRFC